MVRTVHSMRKHLRTYTSDNLSVTDSLIWTDLVPDPERPQKYLLDPISGQRWERLTETQLMVAREIVAGSNHREACKAAGIKAKPESMSVYVSGLLSFCAPFANEVLIQLNAIRQSQTVTSESHLKRLDQLGRRAEKEGKYSAAIAAEVNRGRVAGLYAKNDIPQSEKVRDSLRSIDERIQELLAKDAEREKQIEGSVVSDNE